jgi:oxygen-independent coproporphyrinogen-3 oxidase
MEPAALEAILAAVPGKPWAEASLEASPGTITVDKARSWRACGINRVSLGVQSFVRQEIAATGRKHTAETVVGDLVTLRQAGIANFNIDLIAGLAGQTAASWRESLDWIEKLEAPHVSVYMFEIDDDSRLGRETLLGGVRYGAANIPSETETADMYEFAVERLEALGIPRYEISNFARPGFESVHNLKYWRLLPYIGFGADAHSFDGTLRWQNAESPAEYVACGAGPRPAQSGACGAWQVGDLPHPANLSEEKFFVGLRLSAGIRPTVDEWRIFAAPIRRFVNEGLLESQGDTLRLTGRGVMLSNEVFQEFLNL